MHLVEGSHSYNNYAHSMMPLSQDLDPMLHDHVILGFLFQYRRHSLLLAACQLRSGQTFCLLQGCEQYNLNGQPVFNNYECPYVYCV